MLSIVIDDGDYYWRHTQLQCRRLYHNIVSILVEMNLVARGKIVDLCYFADPVNAGDFYNIDYLKFFIKKFNYAALPYLKRQGDMMFCGSLIHAVPEDGICCGLGLIKSNILPNRPLKHVISVRGPLTIYHCMPMLPNKKILMGDPGVLAGDVFVGELKNVTTNGETIGVIPHYSDKAHAWIIKSRDHPIRIIDIQRPPLDVLSDIKQCCHVYSSSLHGIIFAHALNIPATWVEFSSEVIGDGFKFYDYYLSLGVNISEVARHRISDVIDVSVLHNSQALPKTEKIKDDVLYSLSCLADFLSRSDLSAEKN